jgi:hypothetical protein
VDECKPLLNGTALEALNRPSLLITDALNARAPPPPKVERCRLTQWNLI